MKRLAKPCILAVNGGSSSIKFAFFEGNESLKVVMRGSINRIAQPGATLRASGLNGDDSFSRSVKIPSYRSAVDLFLSWLDESGLCQSLLAIGHRIVQGGPNYSQPEIITAAMITDLQRMSSIDPEHLPNEILLAQSLHQHFPGCPQVACFDTAFHHDMPQVAKILPIPRRYEKLGIHKYGFHGLSYEFLLKDLSRIVGSEVAQGRVIFAHLGSGASLAAVKKGLPLDTSMSFTPTSGVPMSTRSGDLDPGLSWYLQQVEGLDGKAFHDMVNFKSGLLGISETSSDMEDLLKTENQDHRAAEAIAVFCYQVKKCIGSFATVLGGLDVLVFAGGIGENSAPIRERVCAGLEFLGIEMEENQNNKNATLLSKISSRVAVYMIHTDEEGRIAENVYQILELNKKKET